MVYVVLDTETTGLDENSSVIQLAYFVLNDKFELIDVKNYFCYSDKPLTPEIEELTGITNDKLKVWSKGYYLEEYLLDDPIFRNTSDVVFVGHNIKFDTGVINQTLKFRKIEPIDFGRRTKKIPSNLNGKPVQVCTAECLSSVLGFQHYIKLQQMFNLAFYNKNSDKIDKDVFYDKVLKSLDVIVKKFNVDITGDLGFHNALFDVYITFLIFVKYRMVFK